MFMQPGPELSLLHLVCSNLYDAQLAMPVFQSKKFRSTSTANLSFGERIGVRYRANLNSHPFLLFGLPFISIIVMSSFLLTPATALRYERHDRKVKQLTQEEAMSVGLDSASLDKSLQRNTNRRIVGSEKDEYYVRAGIVIYMSLPGMLTLVV